MEIKSAALIGVGAVGSYFAYGLPAKLGDRFCVIASGKRKERLEKEGIYINGERCPLNLKTAQEAGKVDLVLVATKQTALPEIMDDICALVGENTIVLSLLNGVTSEEIIGNEIGMEHMLYSLMRIDAVRDGNHMELHFDRIAGVFFGEKDYIEPTKRVQAVLDLFEGTSIRANYVPDIMTDLWLKYVSNVSQNLPQAILGAGVGCYQDSVHMKAISNGLGRELEAIAAAKGIDISKAAASSSHGSAVPPSARYSTLQDLDARRHTEIDMFSGALVRMGRELGIPTPYNEYTYHIIKALEEKNDGKFDYSKEGGEVTCFLGHFA